MSRKGPMSSGNIFEELWAEIPNCLDTMGSLNKITADQVISKLKDDGDFDRLRLKIIRKLKENEDLRNSIISVVKQSALLNRTGAENMKTRDLCDSIHEEVRGTVMSQISKGVWHVIRSDDGMQTEIMDTVQSVCHDLLNPQQKEENKAASSTHQTPLQSRSNGPVVISSQTYSVLPDGEPRKPPGFSLCSPRQSNHNPEMLSGVSGRGHLEVKKAPHSPDGSQANENPDPSGPHGFSSLVGKHKDTCDGSDEDPDVPPGFG